MVRKWCGSTERPECKWDSMAYVQSLASGHLHSTANTAGRDIRRYQLPALLDRLTSSQKNFIMFSCIYRWFHADIKTVCSMYDSVVSHNIITVPRQSARKTDGDFVASYHTGGALCTAATHKYHNKRCDRLMEHSFHLHGAEQAEYEEAGDAAQRKGIACLRA